MPAVDSVREEKFFIAKGSISFQRLVSFSNHVPISLSEHVQGGIRWSQYIYFVFVMEAVAPLTVSRCRNGMMVAAYAHGSADFADSTIEDELPF